MANINAPLRFINGDDIITVIDPTAAASWDVIDVAGDYGTNTVAIQAAIDQAHMNYLAGEGDPTTVYLRAGLWIIDGSITLKSYVTVQGAGRESTVLRKTGFGPVFGCGNGTGIYSDTQGPITRNFTVQDLWIDCSQQTAAGVVSPGWSSKGMVLVDVARGTIRRVGVSDSMFSGIGLDYPSDHTIIDDCIVINPNRNGGTDGGGNGFGTMSGRLTEEDYIISNCTAIGGRAGYVLEIYEDISNDGRGARIANCISIGSRYGFENAGVAAATFDSCIAINSQWAGFKFGEGDHGGLDLSTGLATMNNCFAIDSLGEGVHAYFDTPAAARNASLVIQGCVIDGSAAEGILVSAEDFDVANITIRDNTITNNVGGINLDSSGTGEFVDPSIHGNDLRGNTGTAIRLDADITRGRIEGNNVTGGASTKGIELVAGRTATGLVVNGGRLSTSTPVDIAGTLADCHVGFVPGWTRGAGAPTVTAPLGTVYQRTDGTAGTLLYVNTDGGTTWSAYA